MKAISIWQPWATLIAIGAKRIETRSWPTNHRGPIAVHASKGGLPNRELWGVLSMPPMRSALARFGATLDEIVRALPRGAIVAIADLVACEPTDVIDELGRLDETRCDELETDSGLILPAGSPVPPTWTERELGDFTPGRFGWIFGRVRALGAPIAWRGEQGLFEITDMVLRNSSVPTETRALFGGTQ